jgi:VWFA-related protein
MNRVSGAQSVAACLLMSAALAQVARPATRQIPTYSTRIEAVRVDVLVTKDGQPVKGLQTTDFEVRDNGVVQKVDLVTFQKNPVDVVLVLDMSASVAGQKLAHLRDAGRALLTGLQRNDRASLVTFNHVVALRCGLTADLGSVETALRSARGEGDTSLVDATFAGMMLTQSAQDRPGFSRGVTIVFSDGRDTSSWLTPKEVLDTAAGMDVVVYGVSMGRLARGSLLRELTSATGGGLFEVASTSDLRPAFVRALDEFRNRYLLSYSPSGVAKGGWHRLDVRVKGRGLEVRARPGYGVR